MERTYAIDWYPTKDGPVTVRRTMISISKATGETNIDAKRALNLFIKSCGNLKKNTIVRLREFDQNKKQLGEDIVPSENENAIIPSGR